MIGWHECYEVKNRYLFANLDEQSHTKNDRSFRYSDIFRIDLILMAGERKNSNFFVKWAFCTPILCFMRTMCIYLLYFRSIILGILK